MGRIIVNKVRGMSWTAKISLMLIFTLILSVAINNDDAAAACTRNQPTLSISPASKTISIDGGSANYTLTITNNDTGGCADETFNLPVTDSNSTDFITPSTLSLNPVTLAQGANTNVTLSVTAQVGKTSGSNNTYVTATSANHTPLQSNTVTTTILITNPLMHNSVTLSSTKWSGVGGWGIAGGKYGEFTCGTCHSPVTTNIKRIATSITTPDAGKGTLPGDGQPILYTRTSGTISNPGLMGVDQSPYTPRASSDRICEVCHTYDATQLSGVKAHPYNSLGNTLTNHLSADATDCTSCHKHSAAFSGAGGTCDSCHGATPSVFWSVDKNANGNAPGAHAKHFGLNAWYTLAYNDINLTTTTYYRYNCQKCHDSGHGTTPNPKIDFSGTNDPPTSGGSYASNTCSNLYCHGNFTGGLNASPTWTGTAVCGSCHGTPPSGGSHTRHAGSGAGALQVACDRCHEDTATGSSAIYDKTYHVNYYSNWNLMRTDLKLGGSAVYNSLEKGQKSPPSATYAACGSVYCHSNVQNNLGTAGPTSYGTPTWGAASVSCAEGVTGCHGNPPATGNHVTHATTLTYVCSACHTGAGDETAAHANRLINMSIAATYGGTYSQGTHAPGSGGYGTCSNTYCHGNYTGGLNASPTWGVTAACGTCHKATNANPPTPGNHGRHAGQAAGQLNIGCAKCHPARAAKDKHQDLSVQWALDTADGKFGGSAKYNSFASGATGAKAPSGTYKTCTTTYCHSNVQNNLGTAGPTSYGTPTWGGTVSCAEGATGCHGNAPATGNHAKHMSQSGVTCSTCHSSAGDETAVHANNVINMSMSAGIYSQGSHTPGSGGYGTCSTSPCHSSGQNATGGLPPTYGTPTWGGGALNCGSCHKNMDTDAAATGNHTKHAQGGYNIACATCHNGYTETTVAGATHVNNLITLSFSGIAPATTYSQGNSHALGNGYGTCSTAYCHSNVQGAGGSGAPSTYGTPTWGGALNCGSCHKNMDTDAAATGSHTKHAQTAAIACATCHNGYTETTVASATHVNNSINLSFSGSGTGTTYSQGVASAPGTGYGTCSTSTCHGTSTPPTWGATSTGCNFCHPYTANDWITNNPTGTPIAVESYGSHAKHITHIAARFSVTLAPSTDSFGTGNAAKVCGTCHTNTVGNHISGSRTINFGDGTYKEGGSTGFSFLFDPGAPGTNPPIYNGVVGTSSSVNPKTCSNISCHFSTTPVWSAY